MQKSELWGPMHVCYLCALLYLHMRRILLFVALSVVNFFAILLLNSCTSGNKEKSKTPDHKIELISNRFDVDLYSLDTNNLGVGLSNLKSKYPDFLDYYLDTLMAYNINGNYNDTVNGVKNDLKIFLTFKDFKDLQDSITKHFPPNDNNIKERLVNSFGLMKQYLPKTHIPRVFFLNMGLSKWPSFAVDTNTLCIGLDMFLGDGFPHYVAIGIHEYLRPHNRADYLPVAAMTTWYRAYYPWVTEDRTLLDLIIQKGKEQYFLHQVLPDLADSTLFGFKQRHLDWCNRNEALVYNYFIQQKLLYSTIAQTIMPYVTDGPFAKGIESTANPEKETPGNIGTWLGYRIVSSFMQNNSEVTLNDLLSNQLDPIQILNKSQYKPR